MIFYFSATGNSKYVAQRIAQNANDELISISECLKEQKFSFEVNQGESIGFVFPTYLYGTPTIVADFIEKLELRSYTNQYTYAIATCGYGCEGLFGQLKKLLSQKGIKLNGGSEIIFPDNYILLLNLLPSKEQQQSIFIEAEKHIDQLIAQTKDENLPPVKLGIKKFFKTQLMYPIYIYGRKTKHFYATDACNSCKRCEKICPINIITIDNGKPKWTQDKCVQCLACLHRCPQKAIQHKKRTEKRGRYKNPNVTL